MRKPIKSRKRFTLMKNTCEEQEKKAAKWFRDIKQFEGDLWRVTGS